METKDRKSDGGLWEMASIASGSSSDHAKGSKFDLDKRRQNYGVNKVMRKLPPSKFGLFAIETTMFLLIVVVISVTVVNSEAISGFVSQGEADHSMLPNFLCFSTN
jgi:hypothetical protein